MKTLRQIKRKIQRYFTHRRAPVIRLKFENPWQSERWVRVLNETRTHPRRR